MSDILTRFHFDGQDRVAVERVQDVEHSLEHAKELAKQANSRTDVRHKWHLPNVLIEKLYNRYCGGGIAKPMNTEFWVWVDKEVMTDESLSAFRTNNSSNPFFIGYGK